jgi:hypothetical protein
MRLGSRRLSVPPSSPSVMSGTRTPQPRWELGVASVGRSGLRGGKGEGVTLSPDLRLSHSHLFLLFSWQFLGPAASLSQPWHMQPVEVESARNPRVSWLLFCFASPLVSFHHSVLFATCEQLDCWISSRLVLLVLSAGMGGESRIGCPARHFHFHFQFQSLFLQVQALVGSWLVARGLERGNTRTLNANCKHPLFLLPDTVNGQW